MNIFYWHNLQDSTSCSIQPSWMGEHGKSGENGKDGQHGEHGEHGQHGEHGEHGQHGQHQPEDLNPVFMIENTLFVTQNTVTN